MLNPIVAVVSAATHKLMVWVDMRSTLTPGQKYVYWEKAGVHLRIEIGMKEVKAKMCKVVKSSKPEDYRSVVKVDSPLLGRALLKTLKKLSPVELEWLEVPTAPPSEDDGDDNLLINIQERIRISKLKETLITTGVAGEGSVAAELSSTGSKRALATGAGAVDSGPPMKRRKDAAAASDATDDDSSDDDSSDSDSNSDSDDSAHGKQQKPSRKHQRGSSGEDSDTTSSGEDASDDSGADSDDSGDATEGKAHEDETSVRAPVQGAVASDTSDDDGDDDDDDDDDNVGSRRSSNESNEMNQSAARQGQPQKRRMDSGDALSDDGFDSDDDDSKVQDESIESVEFVPAPVLPGDASSKRVAKKGKVGRARGAVVRF